MKKSLLILLSGLSCLNAAKYPQIILRESSGKNQATVPVTFGQAFPKGTKFTSLTVGAGTKVYPTQVDVKRTYDDGSIKHALISFVLPSLGANEALTLNFADAAAPTGAPITIAATDVPDVTVQFTIKSVVEQVSLRSLIGASANPRLWLKGPVVTEAIYEGAPVNAVGLLPDPFLNVQFHVRLYKPSNIARVSVIVDNTWKSNQGNVKYAVRILSAGTPLYQNDAVTHYHNARWKKDFVLGGPIPGDLQIVHDVPYLIATGLIPRYHMGIKLDPASIPNSWASWTKSKHDILGNGLITPYFPTTGGREDIGMYPGWTVRYLLSMDNQARTMTFGTADMAGSFPIHYRDNKDKYLLSIEDYPTLTLNQSAAEWSKPADKLPLAKDSLNTPYEVDCSHQPSMVYIPYLLSGDLYYLQEQYQWTNYCLIEKNYEYRSNAAGLVISDQVRGQAWTLRNIADAAAIAPDVDREKGYFDRILKNNIQYYDTAVVSYSALGAWGATSNLGSDGGRPDENMDASVRSYTSPWMTDFLSLVFDHAIDLGYTQAKPVRDHLLLNAIGRTTSGPGYNPLDAANYHLAYADAAGKPYADWATVYQKTFAHRTSPTPKALPDDDCAGGYSYILRAALTAAARDHLPKGKEAFDFMESNMSRACFAQYQIWALVPVLGDAPPIGKTGAAGIRNGSEPKKKAAMSHVGVFRQSGGLELTLIDAANDERVSWKISDANGKVLQTAEGITCRVASSSCRNPSMRFYSVRTGATLRSGMIAMANQ